MTPFRIMIVTGFILASLVGERSSIGGAAGPGDATQPASENQDFIVQRDGFELHYEAQGSGRAMVFLSGGPGIDVGYMKEVAEELPSSYRRVFLHQRGTGRSQLQAISADKMTMKLQVEDVDAVRADLHEQRLLLVGHSWGGMLAMAYAAKHPDRVDRIILIGSGGPTLEFYSWFGDNIQARLHAEDRERERHWSDAAKRGVSPDKACLESIRAISPGYFFDRAAALKFAAEIPEGSVHAQAFHAATAALKKGYDLREGLQKLDRPVLILHGHQDPIGDKTAEEIHHLIPGSTLHYIHRCGHFPWIEQRHEFQKAVQAFLQEKGEPERSGRTQ